MFFDLLESRGFRSASEERRLLDCLRDRRLLIPDETVHMPDRVDSRRLSILGFCPVPIGALGGWRSRHPSTRFGITVCAT